ncbi:MAG: GNAT family N-acetyltransferase [Pseudaminobacter sp.]|nr:GNAT family N-acetyltransferase [Pseudaminobacter sp.]
MVDAAQSFDAKPASNGKLTAPASPGQSITVSPLSREFLDAYADFCRAGIHAPAQSLAWVAGWTAATKADWVGAVIRSDGRPVFALALEVTRSGPFRIARFMGATHANGNFAAADPSWLASATATDMHDIAAAIARARPDIDILAFERLLLDIDGLPNPLLALPHYESPNISLAVDLSGGFDALLDRSSGKRKRKKHRSQTRKFETAGKVERIEAKTAGEVSRLLDAFFAMKEERFRKAGIANVFEKVEIRAFFRTLFTDALSESHPAFVLHAFQVDGKPRAVTGSSRSGKRIVCEFGAIVEDELAHASPGDFLFFENIREACKEGLELYDFSVGDEPYKRLWCDVETRHADVIVPISLKGRALAVSLRWNARMKAFVKTSPLIWKVTRTLRKRAAGRPAESTEE